MKKVLAAISFAAVACASTHVATREAAPETTAPAPTSAAESAAPVDAPAASNRPSSAAAEHGEPPPPLRAGSGSGYTLEAGTPPTTECAPDSVRKKLEQVVVECRKKSDRVCGELKVRPSQDGKTVQVTLDVTKQSFDDSFSRCLTSRMNAVEWQCTLAGSDVTLDLGCDL